MTRETDKADQAKPGLVPKLRFPEFREPWNAKKLGALGDFIGGGTPDKTVTEYWDGDIPWISSSDLEEDDISSISISRLITSKAVSESATKLVKKGSVLFVSRVGTGKVAIAPVELCTSQDFTNLLPHEHLNQYIAYYFVANKRALVSLGQGTSIKGFSKSDLEAFELAVPSLAEQQKIAECLSTLDELIGAASQKLDALKAHKKGLMQQLFPRENETLPRLRFPEFQDAPEWEYAKIADRCSSFSGGTPSTGQKEFYGGSIPFIRSAEIGKQSTELFLTDLGLENSAAKRVSRGDVLVALYGANSGDVALAQIDGAINQAILCLKPEGDSPFLYHYLTLRKDWIVATYIQGGQGNLSGEIVKSITLRFPSTEEQQRIASCLSSLDDLIAAQSTRIDALKTHKQGLMQQLFPSPAEATA